MFHGLKMNKPSAAFLDEQMWKPSASLEYLKYRAWLLAKIREFFAERKVLEVETPLMCSTTIPDPAISSITTNFNLVSKSKKFYLQTSPEFAMKRLLAAGSGSIYQICKAFRNDELGRWHNPEFTLLEWYRVDFDLKQLMQEVDMLLQTIVNAPPLCYLTYTELFQKFFEIDPLQASISDLQKLAEQHQITVCWEASTTDYDTWLQLLLSHVIEPQLGHERPVAIYEFPASQAALSRLSADKKLAQRFEIYWRGIELANGFHELTDAGEQAARFQQDLSKRHALKLDDIPIDNHLLAALKSGLPDCSGVALGVDRLIMLAVQCEHLNQVLSFAIDRV